MQKRVSILGVPIDALTREEAVTTLLQFLMVEGQRHVTTPNNEMLVEASKNEAFRHVLCTSDLALPDSTGLLWAARFLGGHLPQRVPGVDTVESLCGHLTADHSVFFLGAENGAGKLASEKLKKQNKHLLVAGVYEGSPREEDAAEIVRRVNASGAHLLLVAYGAPKQDLWIANHLRAMPHVRVAMGVGGTFDFLAGSVQRAPRWMRAAGLEWLWRFFLQPSRMGRMWRAVVVFPMLVVRWKVHVYLFS